ncbi:MAG: helix-turn-helix transcriptional regulator [Litorimonas sp.]
MDDGSTLRPSQVMYRDTPKDGIYSAAKSTFGGHVKRVRKSKKLSQEELGLKINADQAYISRIEAGSLNPTIESIAEIAQALNVKISELF